LKNSKGSQRRRAGGGGGLFPVGGAELTLRVDGEEDLERRTGEAGDGPVDRGAVALFEGGEEAGVGGEEDQALGVFGADLEGLEPGGELVGFELVCQSLP
jgi:hypothetical protein